MNIVYLKISQDVYNVFKSRYLKRVSIEKYGSFLEVSRTTGIVLDAFK